LNYRRATLQGAPILIDIQQQGQAWMQQRKLIPLAFPDIGQFCTYSSRLNGMPLIGH